MSPDFYKLVPCEGKGYKPVGYGFDSVSASITMAYHIENEVHKMPDADSLVKRQEMIRDVDKKGIIATPANSFINELVVEAARISILNDGDTVNIEYGQTPQVKLRSRK
mgnify:FL=1